MSALQEALIRDSSSQSLKPLSGETDIQSEFAPNRQYKEVRYYGKEPVVIGKAFQLDKAAELAAFRPNPLAKIAITIAEAELVLTPEQAGEFYHRFVENAFPDHLLNIGNWFTWQSIIGVSPSKTFSFELSDQAVTLQNGHVVDIDLPVYKVTGVSFSNAMFASLYMNDEAMRRQAGLHFAPEAYVRLLEPFGVMPPDAS